MKMSLSIYIVLKVGQRPVFKPLIRLERIGKQTKGLLIIQAQNSHKTRGIKQNHIHKEITYGIYLGVNYIKVLLIFFVIFMQTIQLKTEEYQLLPSTDNLFQLRPLPSQSTGQLDLQYNFAPLKCSKTEKLIRTLPSISQEKSNSTLFSTQIDVEFVFPSLRPQNLRAPPLTSNQKFDNIKSMKNLAQNEKAIYVSKPSSHYCQICKDTFMDYLQHINHSSHQKKLKQGTVTEKDFVEIQSILKNKNLLLQKQQQNAKLHKVRIALNSQEEMRKRETESKKLKKVDSRGAELKGQETNPTDPKVWHSIFQEEDNLFSSMNFGSKKRIVESDCGERDFVVLSGEKVLKKDEKEKDEKSFEKQVSFKIIDSTGNNQVQRHLS